MSKSVLCTQHRLFHSSKPISSSSFIKGAIFKRSLLAACIASAVQVQAQTNADQQLDTPLLEEIVVTVNRREQNLQDVSQTVQVFSSEDLEKLGINSEFSNLQFSVPGLQIANQEGKIEVYLRGIGSSDSDFSSDPSVATHYNGIYLPRPRGIGPLFFDSERVEVNKGPQGTLRGRNATGGTINIISNKPVIGEFLGSFGGSVGNFNMREVNGIVNVPTTENSALRLAVWSKTHDGLYSNAFNDGGRLETPSSKDDVAYRLSYLWQPTDEFSLNVIYADSDVKSSGDPGAFTGRSLSAGYDINDLDDPWNQYFRRGGLYEQEVETFLVKASYDFDSFGIEYNGSRNDLLAYNQNASREWQLGQNFPTSGPEAAFIASGEKFTNSLRVNDTFYQADRSQSETHEIRFYSHEGGIFQWTAGAFLFNEEFDYLSFDVGNGFCGDSTSWLNSDVLEGDTISCFQNGLGGENRGDGSEVSSSAVYADGTLSISDDFRLLAGIRQTNEEKIQRDFNAQYQFNFTSDFFLSQPGFNEPSDLIIGGPGFRLTDPGQRSITNFTPGSGAKDLFFDGVAQFGLGDNWASVLNNCEQGVTCDIVVSSSFCAGGSLRADNRVKDNYMDWRVGFEWDMSDSNLIYATLSTGTRSGGINRPLVINTGTADDGSQTTTQVNQVWQPEELLALEIGAKNQFDIGKYSPYVNAALFHYDYTDYVAQLLVDVNNLTGLEGVNQQVFTDNVGDATVFGLELEGNVDLDYGFNVNATLLLLDSELKNTELVDARNPSSPLISVDGNDLPNVSSVNMNLRISQEIDSPFDAIDTFDWTLNTSYRSSYFLSAYNSKGYRLDDNGRTVEIPLLDMPAPNNNGNLSDVGGAANANFYSDEVPGYWLFNINAGMNFGDGQYRLDAFVENVTEEAVSTKGFINNSVNIRYLNAPRIMGLRFRADF